MIKSIRDALAAILLHVDDEIEQRKHGGNDEDWAGLEKASSDGHSALRNQPEPVAMLGGIHGVELIRHIKQMHPKAQKDFHTPLYTAPR